MSSHPLLTLQMPREQQLIRARCFHPTGTFVEFTKDEIEQAIPDRFEQQVRRYPERLAVKTRTQPLTYEALNRLANRVAHALLAQRGGGEEPIALLLEQGAPSIAALLGVLKAGKICVPLDPSFPSARLADMLEDAQAGLVLSNDRNRALTQALAQHGRQVLDIDRLDAHLSEANLGLSPSPDAPAYVLYTSGSTGPPKGVVQNHRNVLHMIMRETNGFRLCADDRLILLYSPSFIGAVRITLGALLNGAALFPFEPQSEGIGRIAAWLMQEEITFYNSVATLFRHFVKTLTGEERFPKLRLILVGSETIYQSDVELYKNHFSDDCLFVAGLGATEISHIRRYFIDKKTEIASSGVPAGYAEEDTVVLLLDEADREVGVDRVGEIAIKSRYLAVGYWRRPDLTNAAFRPDPGGGNARIYRTGDLGRLRPDGCLVHLGRKDLQVKVRGQRVEVADVEGALLGLDGVQEAVVMAREDRPGDHRLVAYLVAPRSPKPSTTTVRHALAATMPGVMIPSVFVWLDALPRLPGGKVDRAALPPPDLVRPELAAPFVAPRTPVEGMVARLWAEVLGLEQVGIHDNFLELGGHSLSAAQIVSRVQDTFHLEVPLRTLLEAPTVADMAVIIVQSRAMQVGAEALAPLLAEVQALPEAQAQRPRPLGQDE